MYRLTFPQDGKDVTFVKRYEPQSGHFAAGLLQPEGRRVSIELTGELAALPALENVDSDGGALLEGKVARAGYQGGARYSRSNVC